MALLELTLQYTYQGQENVNRFNYLSTGVPSGVSLSYALLFAAGMIPDAQGDFPADTLFSAIRSIISGAAQFDQALAKDVYSVTDFFEMLYLETTTGLATGETMSPAVAVGFRSSRVRSDIRRATKRFGGCTEAMFGPGGLIAGGGFTLAVANVSAAMSGDLTYSEDGNNLTFSPVVVGKEKYLVPGSNPARYAYRYYSSYAEQAQHLAENITWSNYDQMRTQVSRQYGRGR